MEDALRQKWIDQTSIFFETANGEGQPYIQHRGGPKGFLRVRDDKTIVLVDFPDNRRYIRQGILFENSKGYLFLIIDYARPDASRSRARRSR